MLLFFPVVDASFNRENFLQIIELLVSYGADVNCERDGYIPALTQYYGVIDFLYDVGVDFGRRLPDRGKSLYPTMTALAYNEFCHLNDAAYADLLFKHIGFISDSLRKSDLIERADLKGQSLLHLVSASGGLKSVQVLIDQGADINAIHTSMRFRESSVISQVFETPLDKALQMRDDLLNTLYQREASRLSQAGKKSSTLPWCQLVTLT